MGGSASTELAETTDTSGNSVVEAQTSKLPSWLQTDPVKLVPLNKLIREREMMHQMAEGKISAKIYKMEHLKQGPTPHQLAMHSVHVAAQMKQKQQQKQQLAEISSPHESDAHTPRSASEKAAADGLDDKVAAVVKHSLHVAEEKAHGKHVGKNHHAHHVNRVHHVQHHQHAQHAHAGKTAHVVMLPEIEKELAAEKDELEMVKHGEARQIALIEKHLQSLQKQEVHRLAMLKRRDHIEELKLKLGIEELAKKVALEKAQEPATPQPMSEKAKIKAEMARVEEEEHERLAALRAKLDKVQGHPHGHPHQAKAPPAKDAEDKAAVAPELGAGKAARETTLAAKAPACTNDDCDLGKEDDKWLAHKYAPPSPPHPSPPLLVLPTHPSLSSPSPAHPFLARHLLPVSLILGRSLPRAHSIDRRAPSTL
jgi:hypothetical protein